MGQTEKVRQKDDIKLDEILKKLFGESKPLIIPIINYFFNENFDQDQECKIEFTGTESVGDDLRLMRADLVVKVDTIPSFHFEFQLDPLKGMMLRMFEYGYREALKSKSEEDGIMTICFPKQAVLYLEEGKGVPDDLKLKVIFPVTEEGMQSVLYKVFHL